MSTAAELDRIAIDIDHSDDITVFFSEQSHCSHCLCFFNALFGYCYRNGCQNLFVDRVFNLLQFFLCHRVKVRKIKTQTIRINLLTCLVNMVTQRIPQCLLEQVCAGMVAHGCFSELFVHRCRDHLTLRDAAADNFSEMDKLTAIGLFAIVYFNFAEFILHDTLVA